MFIEEFLPRLKSNTREYAVATSILAFAYHVVGNKQKKWKHVLAVPLLTLGQW